MRQRHLTEFLHGFRGLRFQNRISVIADQLHVIADTAFAPRQVDQRCRTRSQRLKTGEPGVIPYAAKIRDRCTCGRRLPRARRDCRRQCQQQSEIPPPNIHARLRQYAVTDHTTDPARCSARSLQGWRPRGSPDHRIDLCREQCHQLFSTATLCRSRKPTSRISRACARHIR